MDTKDGVKLLKPETIADISGHGAIESYYPELANKGSTHECTDFSNPDKFPDDIVDALKRGELS